MEIKLVSFGSKDYDAMKALRVEALLSPIGIPASYIVPEKERDDLFIGAFEDEKIVGCCILTRNNENVVQLRQMAVHPDYQGKGIGAQIIVFAEKAAKDNGFKILMMHARNPVIEFYKKCGYEINGEEFFEVGMGHREMRKVL
jgi:N-acetylglutamate synthase-like GNAT family acetyltransferase